MSIPAHHYDEAYYKRWYGHPKTRAYTKADKLKPAAFVLSYLRHLKVPVKSVCDLGCGLGHWQDALHRLDPKIRYTGVEYSPHLCAKYGWVEASAADYAPRRKFDLVVCQSVLHHLNDRDCTRAIAHIADYCRGALYLEIVTAHDWATVIDRRFTDPDIYKRPASWYKNRLKRHFQPVGGGLFLSRNAKIPLLDIEKP